jgi:hypothetical protein
MIMSSHSLSGKPGKTLALFSYDWDAIEFGKLDRQWPHLHAGFDLFSSPSSMRLAWFDMDRFCTLAALKARIVGARGVVSNHEQFGALCAALLAEKMQWPGTSVEAVLACQHKLYAREILQRVAPEANIPYVRLEKAHGSDIPEDLTYPAFVKPVKAAFSVLAKRVQSHQELVEHTRFGPWEGWVIRHLVEPFEKILRRRLPAAGSAHSLIIEAPQHGRQFCLDGYFYDGSPRFLGVVDAIMYPGTDAFMRFDYPGHLPEAVQKKAEQVATRFMQAIGFTHGFFNMEFVHDEASGQIKVIEFNPRLSSQFSDLYRRVDGLNLHGMAMALSHGIDPAGIAIQEPTANLASSFVYRSFDSSAAVPIPAAPALQALKKTFPDSLLFQYPKSPGQIQRDFKWLGSHRYGIIHLGGNDPNDLRERCEHASSLLGWPAPYVEDIDSLPGLGNDSTAWPFDTATENAPG